MNNFPPDFVLTSFKTVGTTAGLTDIKTTSDSSTTGTFSMIVFAPSS